MATGALLKGHCTLGKGGDEAYLGQRKWEGESVEMKDCTQILHILRWSEVWLAEVHVNAQSQEEVQNVIQHCPKALQRGLKEEVVHMRVGTDWAKMKVTLDLMFYDKGSYATWGNFQSVEWNLTNIRITTNWSDNILWLVDRWYFKLFIDHHLWTVRPVVKDLFMLKTKCWWIFINILITTNGTGNILLLVDSWYLKLSIDYHLWTVQPVVKDLLMLKTKCWWIFKLWHSYLCHRTWE